MIITTRQEARFLSPEVEEKLREYHWRRNFELFECLMNDEDHGTKGGSPLPYIKNSSRSVVYYGNEFHGSYNHHNQINKLGDKYYFAWSNGARNEEDAGQRILIAESPDGKTWSDPWVILDMPEGSEWAHNCVALYADKSEMTVFIMTEETVHDETAVGMRRIRPDNAYIDAYRSSDAHNWEKSFTFGTRVKWMFEAPRPTKAGAMLCVCTTQKEGPAILRWPGRDICAAPEYIFVPEPTGASFPYGESTWYQTDAGRIYVFWRDESGSCRLYVNWSDDDGRSWSAPILTDIPDSMSRLYAGRLSDGRCFIVNNAIGNLLDRRPLALLVSPDGEVFNKVYMVNDDPLEMRRKGLLKANGSQYPCCLIDDKKLLIAYDFNKEDIVCEVIETSFV